MKRIKIIFVLLLFLVFNTKVYAFTYDFEVKVDNTEVTQGETKEIVVNLVNVADFDGTLGGCLVSIKLDDSIVMNGDVRASSGWSLMEGNGKYSVDTANNFKSNSGMFIIPVKVNGSGTVNITNIECSDGETKEKINDKSVTFTIKNNTAPPIEEEDGGDLIITSSPNLKNIILSEGSIDFDPDITEYKVLIKDFDKLDVSIELESSSSSYSIDKNDNGDEKNVVITVTAFDGTIKVYTLDFVIEEDETNNDVVLDEPKEKMNFVPIFIAIIVILVLVNVFRILRNKKK